LLRAFSQPLSKKSGPRLSTGITVLNRFNVAPTIHLPLFVLKLAIIVLAVTNYSKNFKIEGIDIENGKVRVQCNELVAGI
jgi:hypothetical protein